MVQSLDFVMWANRHPADKDRITESLANKDSCEIVVDRHRLSFDPNSRYVTIDRVSEDVPFACKIAKCRLPYEVLTKLLDGDFDDLTGLEWL